ncbi:MAG: glycosyltransferase family 2 protein [Candidatus Omnitrophica bacterium]|nr:glycosyltransferase family 2 protein [Candidatus Omnitrophota bacterium]
MHKVLVCPVAFNENVKLKNAIGRFLKCPVYQHVDYLIVDDCSTDGTTEMIASFKDKGVLTIRHPRRMGVGSAIRTAIKHARGQGYEVLVIMAGNDKDNPDEIPRIIDPLLKDGYDFIQGSRYKGENGIGGDMPFYRKLATRMHPWLMTMITGRRVTDTTNGFRGFRLSIFDHPKINIDQDWLNQYELEPYLLFKAIKLGYKFDEAAVTKIYPSKKLGYTKMQPFVGWWSILRPLIYLGLGIKK